MLLLAIMKTNLIRKRKKAGGGKHFRVWFTQAYTVSKLQKDKNKIEKSDWST